MKGLVYICKNCFGTTIDSYDLRISGKVFGSRFGEVIAAVDLDGDSADDLVVGAPLYSTKVSFPG